jgi:hypothetical protein
MGGLPLDTELDGVQTTYSVQAVYAVQIGHALGDFMFRLARAGSLDPYMDLAQL